MEPQNFLTYSNSENEDLNIKNAIFQAYLQAFFRHQAYICKQYNTGKISELQAVERISAAWQRLKNIQNKLKYQSKLNCFESKQRFYLIQSIDVALYSEEEVNLWN
ncbi:hypothetical protein H6G41_29520 [Tolypothrix sp. FACHB-123]|uniref:DUF7219 family protein n=1 Tax=Tolypothrix sp. FACHB-123 TaxID=2692868 RepID=UPI001689B6B9|nr:hypothetical protein [Tolypothrix sp. FACHB-123]MBD2358688.1 hypothetical protein [Tolypothrix sp. FACHB-123]